MNLVILGAATTLGALSGAHCVAMCAGGAAWSQGSRTGLSHLLAFHAGRIAGYSSIGAVLASLGSSLQWLSQVASLMRPLWIMLNVAVLILGAMLLLTARQPALLSQWGWRLSQQWKRLWQPAPTLTLHGRLEQLMPHTQAPRLLRSTSTGLAWALVPCAVLYSALMLASFAGGSANGALAMALFGLASGVQLATAQYWLAHWKPRRHHPARGEAWGTRITGMALLCTASYSLMAQLLGPSSLGAFCFGAR